MNEKRTYLYLQNGKWYELRLAVGESIQLGDEKITAERILEDITDTRTGIGKIIIEKDGHKRPHLANILHEKKVKPLNPI